MKSDKKEHVLSDDKLREVAGGQSYNIFDEPYGSLEVGDITSFEGSGASSGDHAPCMDYLGVASGIDQFNQPCQRYGWHSDCDTCKCRP